MREDRLSFRGAPTVADPGAVLVHDLQDCINHTRNAEQKVRSFTGTRNHKQTLWVKYVEDLNRSYIKECARHQKGHGQTDDRTRKCDRVTGSSPLATSRCCFQRAADAATGAPVSRMGLACTGVPLGAAGHGGCGCGGTRPSSAHVEAARVQPRKQNCL